MKAITILGLITLSMSTMAGTFRMTSFQQCSSTVPESVQKEVQYSELVTCAEGRATLDLSQKCEGRGQGWLLEADIAKRDMKVSHSVNGRTMVVSAMAVGRCEI